MHKHADEQVDFNKFNSLKHIMINMEVEIEDLNHEELPDIGMNLSYINCLIYDYFKDLYKGCGFYLSETDIDNENLPFNNDRDSISYAYCHLYMVPLNLKRVYFEHIRVNSTLSP